MNCLFVVVGFSKITLKFSDLIMADVDSVHDLVTDGIEKSLVTTDSKPESESDLKPKSKPEPDVDQMKKLALNPEAKEFFPSYKKKNNQSLSSEDFATAKKLSGEDLKADNKKDGNFRRVI